MRNCLVLVGRDDGIRYVSANGNDSNTGCSWGAAKLTVMAAYDSLPSTGGTIYIACSGAKGSCPNATSSGINSIAIMGPADPNYNNPPAGWRKAKAGAVSFVGASASSYSANSTVEGTTYIVAGSSSLSAVWLSDVSGITFRNLGFAYPSQVFRIAIDSNGNRTDSLANDILIWNVTGSDYNTPGNSSYGPAVDVGAGVLWLRIENSAFTGNAAAAVTSVNRYAINVDSGGASYPCSGLIYIENTHYTGGGGFRFNSACNGTGSFVVKNTLMEGAGQSTPTVDVFGTGVWSGYAEAFGCSDSGDNPPVVRVAQGNPNWYMTVVNSQPCGGFVVEGPATIRGNQGFGASTRSDIGGQQLATVSPLAKNQIGDYLGRNFLQTDAARRLFQPSVVRFSNNLQGSTQLPSTWTATSGSITRGIKGPDGGTNAATINGGAYVFQANTNFNVGDYLYAGVWAQQASTAGPNGNPFQIAFPFGCGPATQLIAGSSGNAPAYISSGQPTVGLYNQEDGNWQWIWMLVKAITAASACGFRLSLNASTSNPMNFFAPMFVQVPASSVALISAPTFSSGSESGNIVTIKTTTSHSMSIGEPFIMSGCSPSGYNGAHAAVSASGSTFTYYDSNTGLGAARGCIITPGNDSEMADWAFNTPTYSDSCVVGTICGLRGQTLTEPAFGTLTNCRVNSTSPAACGSATSGSFVVSTGTTSYTVDTTAVTAHSRIFIVAVTDASDLPSRPTCNAPAPGYFGESSRATGKSFTFTLPNTSGTTCWNYWIVN